MSKLENQVSVQNSSKDCDKCSELQRVIKLSSLFILIEKYINETMCSRATGKLRRVRVESQTEKGSQLDSPSSKFKGHLSEDRIRNLASFTAPYRYYDRTKHVQKSSANLRHFSAGIDGNVC